MTREHPRTVAAWMLIAVALVSLAGCASPTERWAVQRDALTATQNTLITAHAANIVGDDVILRADPFVQNARIHLSQAESELPDGGDDFDYYLRYAVKNIGAVSDIITGKMESE